VVVPSSLQHDLRRNRIELEEIDLVKGRTMRENTDAVLRGEIDVALLFEPLRAKSRPSAARSGTPRPAAV
jgi:hypothetical protein